MSKEALLLLVTRGFTDPNMCSSRKYGTEDMEIGYCMANLGVLAADSRDSMGRGNFFPFTLQEHILGGGNDWFMEASVFKQTAVSC
jgi:glycoprotein-N-acetylgalactosamine 3-beta-galactosyltransferase